MIELHRIDPARNMARFYVLDVQPDLFGCIRGLGSNGTELLGKDGTGQKPSEETSRKSLIYKAFVWRLPPDRKL